MSIDVYITQGTPQDVRARYNSLKEVAATLDFGYLDDEVVVLDTETTGLSFKKEELTQIAAARMKKGKITDWFVTFVNPGKPIPANITDLTKITNDDVRDAPTPDFARAKLVEFVGERPIVAHNAPFDFNFCTKDEAGGPLKNNLWIDSLDIARIALVRLNSFRLKELALAFDAPPSTHRADADVESLCAVYRYLLAGVFAMPPDLVEKISQLEDKEVWPTGEVFRIISQLQKAHFEAQQDVTLSPDARIPFNLKALRRRRIHEVEKKTVTHTIVNDVDTDMHDIEGLVSSQSVFGAGKTKQPPLSMPLPEEISDEFSPEGILGKMYDNYERREEQVAMANHVLQAFSTEQNLVIEAGTGVGKSMAYLLPSAFIAMRNNVKVGVATKTNSLLDQLIYKELPALAAALKSTTGQDLRFASLKGFTHYPCLRKIDRIVMDELRMVQVNGELLSQAPVVAQLLSFIEQSEYDDLDAVPLHRHILPRYSITSDSRECMRKKCPFYNKLCFTHGKREQAKYAHIVITNHSLFFIDASSPGPLLPKAPFWIVDEAHGAEDAARKATAQRFSAYEAKRVADTLMSEDARRNPLVSLLRSNVVDQTKQPEAASLYFGLLNKVIHEGKTFASTTMKFLDAVKNLSMFVLGAHAQYDKEEILIANELIQTYEFSRVQKTYDEFALNGQDFTKHTGELLAFLEGFDNINSFINEIALLVSHVSTLLDAAKLVLEKHDSEYIRSFTATKKLEVFEEQFVAESFDVGAQLQYLLYDETRSVVYASATLDSDDNFASFSRSVGLADDISPSSVPTSSKSFITCKLGSSYRYDDQMKVFVVDDLPPVNTVAYIPELSKMLIDAHVALGGSMLTLFTNKKAMNEAYELTKSALGAHGLGAICQGRAGSKKSIIDSFLADETLSLFATKSFWEGFDAPGDTLRGVVITRLPFSNPSSPLALERKYRYSDDWSRFSLPAAIIEFKQAAGRLIRTADDHGVLILTDSRLVTQRYGKRFLNALPSKNITQCSAEELPQLLGALK